MTHDSLCLEGLDDDERRSVVTGIDPETCEYCALISKARAEERARSSAAVQQDIERALRTLYSGDLPDNWMHIPNSHPLFAGVTPAEYAQKHGFEDILVLLNGWLN